MPQPRPALQRLSAPASLHNGDRESEFKGFKGVKWLKINLTRQLKHVLAFSCLWQLVQVYFRRFWGDLSAEKGLSTGFWSALQRRVSSSASLRLALERHSAIQRLPFACTAAPSVRPAARSAALFASASCTLCIVDISLGRVRFGIRTRVPGIDLALRPAHRTRKLGQRNMLVIAYFAGPKYPPHALQ